FSWRKMGTTLSRKGGKEEAILYYDEHLLIHPQDAEVWKLKAEKCIAADLAKEAFICCERAIQLNPHDITVLLYKGYLLADFFHNYEEANECYDIALTITSRDSKIWHLKGLALHNLDLFKKAIACYNKSLRINRKNALTWKDKGDSLNCLALEKKALVCYKKSLKLEPENPYFWYIAALTYDEVGKEAESIQAYKEVIRLAVPNNADLANQARMALNRT
ncbi:MAG: tetratricopeptide repeat protein, partial [Candidatus Auribacterota bacterium]|nr:tetratricopeptide repeat protein [Candidatus Auribacterota bacterium]